MNEINPFFILANPRSGSSLFRIICESHHHLTVPPECGFMEWWYDKYKDWKITDNESLRFDQFCDDIDSSRKFEAWKFDHNHFRQLVKKNKPSNYPEIVGLIYLSYGLKRKEKILKWGDKNNYFIHKTPLLNTLFPKAKYIHLIRDGRDVAVSYLETQNLETISNYKPVLEKDITEIAMEWVKNIRSIKTFLNGVDPDKKLEIRFENLVLDLKEQCLEVCEFLEVPFDEKMLYYYRENLKYTLEPRETLDWKKKTLEAPDKTRIGRYKKVLSEGEIKNFYKIAGSTLKECQYEN